MNDDEVIIPILAAQCESVLNYWNTIKFPGYQGRSHKGNEAIIHCLTLFRGI